MTTRTRKKAGAAAKVDLGPVREALDAAAAALGLEGDVDAAAAVPSVEAALPEVDGTWVTVPLSGPFEAVLVAAIGEPVVPDLVDSEGEAPVLLAALAGVADALGTTTGTPASGDGFASMGLDAGGGTVAAVSIRQDGDRVASLLVVVRPPEAAAPAEFPSLDPEPAPVPAPVQPSARIGAAVGSDPVALALIRGVEMQVTAQLGRTTMTVRELLQLGPGSVIELDRAAGSPVDLLVNGTLIARGEVVVVDEEYGIRVSQIVDPTEEG
jgi:flagellar motor switch protein FliN/FliY